MTGGQPFERLKSRAWFDLRTETISAPVLAQLEPPKVLTEGGEIMDIADVEKESIAAAIVRRSGPSGDDTPVQ